MEITAQSLRERMEWAKGAAKKHAAEFGGDRLDEQSFLVGAYGEILRTVIVDLEERELAR